MRRRYAELFAFLLALTLRTSACASYHDRVAPRHETLPVVQLPTLKGEAIALEMLDSVGQPIVGQSYLRDDLENVLTKAGLRIDDQASLVLRVTTHYLPDSGYRVGRFQSCGHLSALLLRDGRQVVQPISSRACIDGTPNPWENKETQRTSTNAAEIGSRVYFATVSDFLLRFEKASADLGRS
ncbi:MAG: hypothetical protein QOH21_2033 [Acidobacteriota bacterium]|nr:hypothetical protein [Acidobacteriota bacterium]